MARLVGPYEILEEYGPRRDGILGTGGMGTVYAVRQYPFDELHAIKVLHPGLLETPECNRRFAREARIMWELGSAHPNILAVTDFRESDGGMTWLRMPLVRGVAATDGGRWVTLADRMEAEGRMELNVVKKVTGQILSAVEYAHGEGVLHRDLKPANLLLTEDGILLADFGLARALDAGLMRSRLENSILNSMHGPARTVTEEDLLRTNPDTKPSEALALMGTLAYMAPELKPPKYEEHSEQSDLYALGLIVWQMLTGESEPGMGESASDLREDLTERWDTWLSRALARKRERRFASVREMREAWGALVGEPEVKMEGSYAGEARVFGGITMVWCPSGKFLLGSPEEEEGRYISEKQHEVTMEKGFWLAKTECTQGQWESVMGTDVCGQSKKGKVYGTVTGVGRDHPMYFVSWDDAQEWVAKMNDEHPPGECWEWVLPTDAQWEYACRAGSAGAYGGTGNLDEMGWYAENSGNTVHEVGGKRPNDWGFYDMHGNVWEWCANWYREYLVGAVIDPDCDNRVFCRPGRVFRGGCWRVNGRRCRSADRGLFDPGIRYSSLGFRPAICSSR